MQKPLLTVCVITYNQRQYIKKCLDTILEQEVDFPWQLVIADDYSTDGTREIVEEYRARYPDLIHLILQEKNVGPERNWLDLIAYPTSEYLLYSEGDDYFTNPKKLQIQVDFLERHPDFAVCFHPVEVTYEGSPDSNTVFPAPGDRFHKKVLSLDDLLARNFMQTNATMYRWRFTKEDVRGAIPEGIIPGDWFLHLLHADRGKIGFIDRTMATYRVHSGGSWWNAFKDRDKLWQQHGIGHLKMYLALLRLYGTSEKRRDLVYGSIGSMLHEVMAADEKYNQHLLQDIMELMPKSIPVFIASLNQSITVQGREMATLRQRSQELDGAQSMLQQQQERINALQSQLAYIKGSRFWKARNQFAKIAGKEVI